MIRKGLQCSLALVLIIAHVTLITVTAYAEAPSIKLIINPNKTDVYIGSEPIALTAKATGSNLTYAWKVQGPGKIDGQGSAVFYVLPDKVKGTSEQALVTVTVTDAAGQETTETVTFNILSKTDTSEPAKEGMSRNTKIALGVGAAAALGGVLAIAGGGDDDDDDDGEPLAVSGRWSFTGQLTQSTCDFFTPVSGVEAALTFLQSGSNVETRDITLNVLAETSLYFRYSGRISGNNISMAAVDPYVLSGGGTVLHIGSGIDVQNIKDNAGTGSWNITTDCIEGCTGSCQIIWSGNWARTE